MKYVYRRSDQSNEKFMIFLRFTTARSIILARKFIEGDNFLKRFIRFGRRIKIDRMPRRLMVGGGGEGGGRVGGRELKKRRK